MERLSRLLACMYTCLPACFACLHASLLACLLAYLLTLNGLTSRGSISYGKNHIVIINSALAPLLLLNLGEYLGIWKFVKDWAVAHGQLVRDKLKSDPRIDIIIPKPIRRIVTWIIEGDSKVWRRFLHLIFHSKWLWWLASHDLRHQL